MFINNVASTFQTSVGLGTETKRDDHDNKNESNLRSEQHNHEPKGIQQMQEINSQIQHSSPSVEDLHDQMQRMIELQNEQQRQQFVVSTSPTTHQYPDKIDTVRPSLQSVPSTMVKKPSVNSAIDKLPSQSTSEANSRKLGVDTSTETTSMHPPLYRGLIPTTSYSNTPDNKNGKDEFGVVLDKNVGKGTLIWKGDNSNTTAQFHHLFAHSNKLIDNDDEDGDDDEVGAIYQYSKRLEQQRHLVQENHDIQPDTDASALQQSHLVSQQREESTTLLGGGSNEEHLKYNTKELNDTKSGIAAAAAIPGSLASYGGLNEQTPLDPSITPMPPGQHHQHHQYNHPYRQRQTQYQQQYQDATSTGPEYYHYGATPSGRSDPYGTTPRNDEKFNEYEYFTNPRSTEKSSPYPSNQRRTLSPLHGFCHCLLDPVLGALYTFYGAESLHRSFCYGAIDGMLTGAGIVSTFCGMNMLRLHTINFVYSSEIRALVVVFTAATCFADSVCMALGHIWTTHVLANAQARERSEARLQLMNHKADAKGLLVDMLLQKGMLKIDAMSIADTLDGYPDLFVSALTGDSLTAATLSTMPVAAASQPRSSVVGGNYQDQSYDDRPHHPGDQEGIYAIPGTDVAISERDESMLYMSTSEHSMQQRAHDDQPARRQKGGRPPHQRMPSSSSLQYQSSYNTHWRGYPSYYQYTEYDELDPDSAAIVSANEESRKESFFMMLGFSSFAIIPSLIFTWVPTLVLFFHGTSHMENVSDNGFDKLSTASTNSSPGLVVDSNSMIDPNSVAIILTACIMWCLGIWKSRFLDSNWLVFGIETVSVLFVCIFCAYGLGALLNHLFLPNEYQITVIRPQSPSSSSLVASTGSTIMTTTVVSMATLPPQQPILVSTNHAH